MLLKVEIINDIDRRVVNFYETQIRSEDREKDVERRRYMNHSADCSPTLNPDSASTRRGNRTEGRNPAADAPVTGTCQHFSGGNAAGEFLQNERMFDGPITMKA